MMVRVIKKDFVITSFRIIFPFILFPYTIFFMTPQKILYTPTNVIYKHRHSHTHAKIDFVLISAGLNGEVFQFNCFYFYFMIMCLRCNCTVQNREKKKCKEISERVFRIKLVNYIKTNCISLQLLWIFYI